MGEAKRRGSFEKRKRVAMIRNAEARKQQEIIGIGKNNTPVKTGGGWSMREAWTLLSMLGMTRGR